MQNSQALYKSHLVYIHCTYGENVKSRETGPNRPLEPSPYEDMNPETKRIIRSEEDYMQIENK